MPLLEIQALQVVYPNGTEALSSINLQAEAGEIVAIIGRSGAGKSTLLRCINGLQPASAGRIVLEGEEITRKSEAALREIRRKIGFIWQEYNLIDRLPAMTNVLTGRLGYNAPWRSALGLFDSAHRQIALHNLERVNLLHRARHRADRLSGGEKQRVAIARAMSQQPRIVLADEPVASLDPELAEQVMSVLNRVAREDGVLTVINIHQVDLAKRFADRVVGIAQGHVVFDGPPAALDEYALNQIYRFDQHRHEYSLASV
ncbi:MAG: phosphonate ABC transporter ATP-binding protein [Caldilineaceae bacterium]|nr:phosphonate ABC transporter ATP-binding protein [Caldilineaceae bacterium]